MQELYKEYMNKSDKDTISDAEVANQGVPWFTQIDRPKCEAGNGARMLADFPAGKTLLEAKDHGKFIKDGDYWWS